MKTIGIIGAMSEEITYLKEKIEIVTTKNIIGWISMWGNIAATALCWSSAASAR